MTPPAVLSSAGTTELERRLRALTPPPPVLDRRREEQLTERQRQILDQLVTMFAGGFASLTMAEIAARASCSLRTLYGLAPSRDELVLVVVDRGLWRVGRSAIEAVDPDMDPLDAVAAYLKAAHAAVDGRSEAFARDLAAMPAAKRLADFHAGYVVAVARCLLELAVERGDIPAVDTAALAYALGGVARTLSQPDVMPTLRTTPRQAADELVGIVLRGLRAGSSPGPPGDTSP
ncbi:MAG: TetR/AcrR family transcriptional regulator [Actinomycetota bacterium]|jgi:AcrR family transcriptional regulator|nr:TetR/AcrR family transcriptional regulator [Actinomycetota bacterium]